MESNSEEQINSLNDLIEYLQPSQRLDLKSITLSHVLSLTASSQGKSAILASDDMITALFGMTLDKSPTIAKDAVLSLINLSADEPGAVRILTKANKVSPFYPFIEEACRHIIDEESELADPWSMVLSNVSRVELLVHEILGRIEADNKTLPALIKAFTRVDYNKKKGKLHYLGPIFCNLTQIPRGRELFCSKHRHLLDKLVPFASYEANVLRRGGIIGVLKNICFDPLYHDIILNDKDDFMFAILYPLCGPEEYTDEENEKFPMELQYLAPTKKREDDPDLRKMLLECLLQLCATKRFRELMRSKGVYEILREYHKWEAKWGRDKDCVLACENVVDILIKKEEEIGLDNYRDVEVPAEHAEAFVKEDADYVKTILD